MSKNIRSSVTLSKNEKADFARCEDIIRQGFQTFLVVGEALIEIREHKLYREQYALFEDYCQERWGFSRYYAHRLEAAAEVAADIQVPKGDGATGLSDTPFGEISRLAAEHDPPRPVSSPPPPEPLPPLRNERQARPLSKLPREERHEAWAEAVKTAPRGKITAKHVESVVNGRLGTTQNGVITSGIRIIQLTDECLAKLRSLFSRIGKQNKLQLIYELRKEADRMERQMEIDPD